jgi:RNA polymerase sigma-70 factor (ECF subfamily)
MSAEEIVGIEARVRAHADAADMRQAVTVLLEAYGRELFGFLITRLRDYDAAREVFGDFAEDLWKGFPGFRWKCSARVWCYTLARHAASRYVQQARRRSAHDVPLSRAGPLSEIAERVRTETAIALRTETKSRISQLREQLPVDDQTLLILRVNRELSWEEIAQIMLFDDVAEPDALKGGATRLRKRFQLAKEKLRRMAHEAGILDKDG